MSKVKKYIFIIIAILFIFGAIILLSIRSFVGPGFIGILWEQIGQAISLSGSQTVGQVTANRSSNKLSITEITVPKWSTSTISSVIGKAYQIERLNEETSPVTVQFSYNPTELSKEI